MRKQFLKCATAFLLTVSLLLPMLPLLSGAEELGNSQQIKRSVNTAEEIGFTTEIYFYEIEYWMPVFLEYLLNGESVADAIYHANEALAEYCVALEGIDYVPTINENTCYTLGDLSTVLYPN